MTDSGFQRDSRTTAAGKVVLVYPFTGIDVPRVSIFLPLSVLTIAAALEDDGFSVEVLDMRTERRWKQRLTAAVQGKPLFVGISAMTGKQIWWGLKAATAVRRADPGVPIVWGGTHASVLPDETLNHPLVDAVVKGEGRETATVIAHRLADGEDIRGGLFEAPRPKSGVQAAGAVPLQLSEICISDYLTPVVRDVRGLAMVTSRGCPHHCAYCYNKAVHQHCWTADPAETVIENFARLHDAGIRGAMVFDDNFFVSKKRVEAVAEGILSRNIALSIKADCRADTLVRYSDEFLGLLRRAGFEMLYIGAESGSDRVLESVQKGVDVQTLLAANAKLAAVGIRPHYSFMAGLPGETVDDMYKTVQLMRRLKKEHPGAYLSPVKAYVPYPGTPLYETAVQNGFVPPDTLEKWSTYEWNNRPSLGLGKAEARYIEKMTYVTAGLDPAIVELSGINQSRFTAWGFSRFSKRCQKRAERPDLGNIPEMPIVRLVKRMVSS